MDIERNEDLVSSAGIYRLGEIVWFESDPNDVDLLQTSDIGYDGSKRIPAIVVNRKKARENEHFIGKLEPDDELEILVTVYSILIIPDGLLGRIPEGRLKPYLSINMPPSIINRQYLSPFFDLVKTWTPIVPLEATDLHQDYAGVFLGAEKIWKGDAVRLVPIESETLLELGITGAEVVFIERIFVVHGESAPRFEGQLCIKNPAYGSDPDEPYWNGLLEDDQSAFLEIEELAGRFYRLNSLELKSLPSAPTVAVRRVERRRQLLKIKNLDFDIEGL